MAPRKTLCTDCPESPGRVVPSQAGGLARDLPETDPEGPYASTTRFPMNSQPRSWISALLLTLLAACGGEEASPTPGVTEHEIVIGSSSALSGHASFLGTQYTRGSMAWIREVNAAGGVHGRKIRLISYDDQYDPPKTLANTERLIHEDDAFMLFGYVGTPTSVKIIATIQETKIPALGFFTGAEALRTPFQPNIFHIRASYFAEAEGAVSYFVDTLGFKKIAVMYQDDAFGLAVLQGVQLAMGRRDLEVCAADTHERGAQDVEGAVETIGGSGAEAVVMVGTYGALARFIKLCEDSGFRPYFHTVSFVGSEAFSEELREVQGVDPTCFERIVVTQVVPSPASTDLPTVETYRGLFMKHFPEDRPNYVALEGFINARVLVEALRLGGPDLTRAGLVAALEEMQDFDVGIGRTISYGKLDRKGLSNIYYSRLSPDGLFETFEP
ncbi:MAG: branched-chain amino acid transport system substrate-binding protein [Planctomycetota bacterium]|jgi:branched-chain amino acid transport system substrate-binding protein